MKPSLFCIIENRARWTRWPWFDPYLGLGLGSEVGLVYHSTLVIVMMQLFIPAAGSSVVKPAPDSWWICLNSGSSFPDYGTCEIFWNADLCVVIVCWFLNIIPCPPMLISKHHSLSSHSTHCVFSKILVHSTSHTTFVETSHSTTSTCSVDCKVHCEYTLMFAPDHCKYTLMFAPDQIPWSWILHNQWCNQPGFVGPTYELFFTVLNPQGLLTSFRYCSWLYRTHKVY